VHEVPNVLADTVAEHRANLTDYAVRAANCHAKAARARKNGGQLLAEAVRLIREANAYAEAVGLTDRLDESKLDDLATEADKRKADAARQRTVADRKREKEYAARMAKEVAEWEQKLAAWKDGGPACGYCPDRSHPLYGVAFLRLRAKNTIIETSMGVAVPVEKALPLLELVRNGQPWERQRVTGPHEPYDNRVLNATDIDGYQIDRIDPTAGVVKAGCHRVEFAEIERIAKLLGK